MGSRHFTYMCMNIRSNRLKRQPENTKCVISSDIGLEFQQRTFCICPFLIKTFWCYCNFKTIVDFGYWKRFKQLQGLLQILKLYHSPISPTRKQVLQSLLYLKRKGLEEYIKLLRFHFFRIVHLLEFDYHF